MRVAFVSLLSLLCATLLLSTGCSRKKKTQTSGAPEESLAAQRNLCALLTSEELERVVGARPVRSRPSENKGGGLTITACYYEMADATDSISVSVTRSSPGPLGRDPKQFFEDRIESYEKRQSKREKGEEDKGLDFVNGLGDKALWMGTMVGGNLYVLKDHLLISIGVGSGNDPKARRDKAVALAHLLLSRL